MIYLKYLMNCQNFITIQRTLLGISTYYQMSGIISKDFQTATPNDLLKSSRLENSRVLRDFK
jgi:hypothetical protein